MTKKVEVDLAELEKNPFVYCESLEDGNILTFKEIPFSFPQEEIDFLLAQRQGSSAARKNIAYKPKEDRISNHESNDIAAKEKMREILRNYSQRVAAFLGGVLAPYAEGWKLDYASFRPFQEKGRQLRVRARNDLLHVDAFPTRPLHGARILRFFTNINPLENRHWITSLGFSELAKMFGGRGVKFPKTMSYSVMARLERKFKQWTKKAVRSPYDQFMLKMHNFLKENGEFQQTCSKDHWEFPPRSCWAVFTDQVSHAALSGQYALEQTFLVPQEVLLMPDKSPLRVLERLSNRNLVDFHLLMEMFSL